MATIENDVGKIRLLLEGGSGGGGSGGDASASNQLLQLTELQEINNKTLTDTQLRASAVSVTSAGNLSYSRIGTTVTANIKATAGSLYSLTCTNLNASIRYLLLFDSTGSTAGTPVRSYPVYGNGGFLEIGLNILGLVGLNFSTGITFGFSTTATTYTAGSAGDCILGVRYA